MSDLNHPLAPDLTGLRDDELEEKFSELKKKYNIAYRLGNKELLTQLGIFVNMYKDELSKRYLDKIKQSENGDLGEYINVD